MIQSNGCGLTLVGANHGHASMIIVNAKQLIRMTMPIVIALVVDEDHVDICGMLGKVCRVVIVDVPAIPCSL